MRRLRSPRKRVPPWPAFDDLIGLDRCLEELPLLEAKPGWARLRAVRNGRIYFADGNAYFNRPGPRLADSTEMLAEMIHPDIVPPLHEETAWVQHGPPG